MKNNDKMKWEVWYRKGSEDEKKIAAFRYRICAEKFLGIIIHAENYEIVKVTEE